MDRKLVSWLAAVAAICLLLTICISVPRRSQPVFAPGSSGFTLVIDAGHGGEDGGATSLSGQPESELNLQIALRTEDLAALLGIPTLMIRRTDISVCDEGLSTVARRKASDLRNRVKTVESARRPLLLSIHQNHFSEAKYHGAQVFYAGDPHSRALAEKIQEDLRLALDPSNRRQCKPSQGVYLMDRISCSGVLVECGFLSNTAEAELLRQDEYQKKLAMAMLRAIAVYGRTERSNEI